MICPPKLKRGDCVAVVGLSSGLLGEPFVSHEIPLFEKRLKEDFGLKFKYMDNSRKGEKFLKEHPKAKADDLKQAFLDNDVDIIWTTLGGDDTFRTLPFLMNAEFRKIVRDNPKIFLGMSDTTNNHLMLYEMGLMTFYAPSLLADIAELGPEIFPFTKSWLKKLFINEKNVEIVSSPVWYENRESFGPDQIGISRKEHRESHGHEFLYGTGIVSGELLGGCIESLYESIVGGRYDDQLEVFSNYPVYPTKKVWKDKVIFLETSEEQPNPAKLKKMLGKLTEMGTFDAATALIIGKPQNEKYYNEYRTVYANLAQEHCLPTVYNLNFGHTTPRMVLPYGGKIRIDFNDKRLFLVDGLITERRAK